MTQILHIIFYKILAFLKFEMDFTVRGIVKSVGSTLVYGGFAIGAFIFALRALDFLLLEQKIGLFLLHRFISIILFIFFLSVNIGNIVVSYSTLFRSPEISFLLTKPVNPVRIFVIKFFDNFFYSSGTLIMVMVSLLVGFTWYFKVNIWQGVLLFFFNFLPFMLTAGLIGVLLLLLLMNLAGRIGFRKTVGILATGYVALVVAFFKVSSPVATVEGVMKYFPNVDGYFASLIPTYIKFLPSNWLAEAMFWTAKGDVSEALPYYALQMLLTGFLLIMVYFAGSAAYLKTWHRSIDFRENRVVKEEKPGFLAFGKASIFKDPFTESIFKRDIHMFIREPAQIIHLAVLLFLIVLFVTSMPSVALLAWKRSVLFTTIFLAVYVFNLFFVITLALRFVFPLISLEGNVIWKVKSAPISLKVLLKKRLSFPLWVIIGISQNMSLLIVYKFYHDLIIPFALISFAAAWFIIMLNFGMGGLFINLKEKNPVRLSSSQGASISFLFSVVYLVLLVALLFIPLSQLFHSVVVKAEGSTLPIIQLSGIIFLISIGVGYFFYRMGVRSLERDV